MRLGSGRTFDMESFSPRLLLVSDNQPTALEPVAFAGRIDELTLERWIIDNPDLIGEPLLVLGNQLAEFEEDRDRLDILALDRYGEIVLAELKVSDDFRVTDLQALAYAGAYARRSPRDLARTLRHHMQKGASAQSASPTGNGTGLGVDAAAASAAEPSVTYEDALATIASFIEIDDIADWQPSQHVRIKLVAPSFPRRVLQTVKWLGDVYSVRLEAITMRLFETAPKRVRHAATVVGETCTSLAIRVVANPSAAINNACARNTSRCGAVRDRISFSSTDRCSSVIGSAGVAARIPHPTIIPHLNVRHTTRIALVRRVARGELRVLGDHATILSRSHPLPGFRQAQRIAAERNPTGRMGD